MNLLAMLVLLVLLAATPGRADAAEPSDWRLVAPHGRLTAQIVFAGDGAPLQATVLRKRRPVLSATIGLGTVEGCLPAGFKFARGRRATISEHYRTAAGKRRLHRHRARRLVLKFEQRKSTLTVELELDADGFAYRTMLHGPLRRRFTAECSSFTAPAGSSAWLQRYTPSYEGPYLPTPLSDTAPGPIGFPALLQTEATWVLLSESRTDPGQAGSRLELLPGLPGLLAVVRPPQSSRLGAVRTSWRVAVIGSLEPDRRVRPRRGPRATGAPAELVVGPARTCRPGPGGRTAPAPRISCARSSTSTSRPASAGSTSRSTQAGTRPGSGR